MADTTYYVNTDSTAGGTGLTNATAGAERAFASLSEAEALNLDLTTGAADGVCTIYCSAPSGVADTTAVTFNGWTTDAAGYINVVGDDVIGGKWNTAKYRLYPGAGASCLRILVNHFRLLNIQISRSAEDASDNKLIEVWNQSAGCDVRIGNCILKHLGGVGTHSQCGIYTNNVNTLLTIYNTIVYGSNQKTAGANSPVWVDGGTVHAYNCTFANGYLGIYLGTGAATATNCIAAGTESTAGFSAGVTKDYCATDDGSGSHPQTLTPASNYAAEFTGFAADPVDLSLLVGSHCVGTGTDDPGSGLYSDDIIETARASTWDIGAYEYAAGGGPGGGLLARILLS